MNQAQEKGLADASLIDKLSIFFVIGIITSVTVAFLARTDADGAVELSGLGKIFFLSGIGFVTYFLINLRFLRRAPYLTKIVILWVPWAFVTNIVFFLKEPLLTYFLSLSSTWFWCLIYLYFYVIFSKYPQLLRLFTIFFICIMVLSSALYYKIYLIRNLLLVNRVSSINEAYYALMTLPWIFLLRKNLYRYAGCALIALVVFSSMKRTGLIVLILSTLCFFIVENLVSQNSPRLKRTAAPVAALSLLGLVFYGINTMSNDYYLSRFSSIAEDGGSGRSSIYREVFEIQGEADFFSWVIGNGYNSVSLNTSDLLSAHNDWQEVLFDFGLIGMALYIMVHLLIIRKTVALVRQKNQYAPVLAMSYTMFLLMSLTSHLIIYPTYFIYLVALWGSVFAITNNAASWRMDSNSTGISLTSTATRGDGLLRDAKQ